jgi:hypothetical protein
MGPMVLLTVSGRKSGKPRTTPVDLFERNGRSFLVSTHRQESSNCCFHFLISSALHRIAAECGQPVLSKIGLNQTGSWYP